MLLLLLACATRPDPCAAMCARAEELYGACLADWGLGWEAAGYEDGADFVDRCETWAWEMRILERAAVRRGELDGTGAVDATCTQREAALSAAIDAADTGAPRDCAAYTDIAWDEVPWQAP